MLVSRPAVMISDQSFLPILQTGDGRCVVAVVRVENSRLFEIKNAFKDIFLTTLARRESCRWAMLCLSGPSAAAIDSYSADFVRVILSLAARGRECPRASSTGRGKGVHNPGLLRALYDLASRSRERVRCSEILPPSCVGGPTSYQEAFAIPRRS